MEQHRSHFPAQPGNLLPKDGVVTYYGTLVGAAAADAYFTDLLQQTPWQPDQVVLFGKRITTARKVAWYGDENFSYTYSGKTKVARPWTPTLLEIKRRVEARVGSTFNSCLLNLYETGEQGMGWHQDNERELGVDPVIATVSFGAERRFDLRHIATKDTVSVALPSGSLLVMSGATQTYWRHQVPKTKKVREPRISVTFRTIHSP